MKNIQLLGESLRGVLSGRKKIILIAGSTAVVVLIAAVFIFGQSAFTKAASSFFTQSGWLGGQSANTAVHPTNQTNWTNYSAKDANANINNDGDAQLKKADNWQETSDTDFNANTSKDATLAVSGGSVRLLKANGATCSAAGDCQSNVCTGNVCVSAFTCGTSTVSYGGETYGTVQIGTQCWFSKNLNVGTMLVNGSTPPDDTPPTANNPSTVQKWCYDSSSANCTTDGGLYTWAEANGLANSCNSSTCTPTAQGICPTGWHVPTDTEQYTLENYLKTSGQTCNASRVNAWDCSDAGTKLKSGGSSGFNGLLAGNRSTDGSFGNRATSTLFWSSSAYDASGAWNRYLYSGYATVYRYNDNKANGFSVRCLKN